MARRATGWLPRLASFSAACLARNVPLQSGLYRFKPVQITIGWISGDLRPCRLLYGKGYALPLPGRLINLIRRRHSLCGDADADKLPAIGPERQSLSLYLICIGASVAHDPLAVILQTQMRFIDFNAPRAYKDIYWPMIVAFAGSGSSSGTSPQAWGPRSC